MTLVDTERLSEIFNDMKHRAVSIRQLSFVFFGFPTAFWASTSGGFRICKGVRCPPIFSLSNLINAGWLVRKCVDIYIYIYIYIHPLITGTNRKAFCCMLALR